MTTLHMKVLSIFISSQVSGKLRPIPPHLRGTNSEPGLPVVRAGAEKAPKKRACSKPELYSDFTVCIELQHCGLNA